MNRTVFIIWLLVFYLALVAGWSVHAHDTGHPVPDNMCGSHSYGNCFDDGDWIRGYYDKLRHTKPQLMENLREEGWRNFNGETSEENDFTGISYNGQPRVPEDTEISSPQTTGSSDQTCHVQFVRVNSVDYQKCVPEEKFWCDKRNKYPVGSTAREYVEWTMPSDISCS